MKKIVRDVEKELDKKLKKESVRILSELMNFTRKLMDLVGEYSTKTDTALMVGILETVKLALDRTEAAVAESRIQTMLEQAKLDYIG